MQKKIRSSRSRSKFRDLFWVAICCCFAGAVLNSLLFYKSFFRALTKLNEEPIATISFKYKVAQRKFIDRVVWDRLRQNSPVYNGDTIHTQNMAEATIWFTDGNVMELDENTMAQVFLSETEGAGAKLSSGTAVVDSSESESDFTISSYGVEAVVAAGSAVNATAAKESDPSGTATTSVNMQVISGNADVVTAEGRSSVAAGESVAVNAEGQAVENPVLVVSKPSPNAKVLYYTEGKTSVHFEWSGKNLPENSILVLQVAKDREFTENILRETVTGLTSYDAKLAEGTYYWRLKTETAAFFGEAAKEAVAAGRITVSQSIPPELVTPVEDYEYTYRHRKPGVRFIWREAKYASTYRLAVATDRGMQNIVLEQRSSSCSSIISTLAAGTYYWQVTPYYTINRIGLASPSKVSRFTVSQKGELTAPELYLPAENGLVNTEASGKGVNFSWHTDPEAVTYSLKVSDNPELKNPEISITTQNNYYSLSGEALSSRNLAEGKWYWAVSQTDDEGNASPYSQSRAFYTMKGQPAQHSIEPPDGYQVAESLTREMNFTWKTNLPENFGTYLQVAEDQNFNVLVYNSEVTNTKLKGLDFAIGEYYWRLVSYNKVNDSSLITEPKMFKVVGNLDAPVIETPVARAVARDSVPYKFHWTAVEGADYYKFNIYESGTDQLLYEDTAYDTAISLDLYGKDWTDRSWYYVQIQAQAMAVPGVSSRRSGNLASSTYQLVKLKPVEITAPAKNKKIAGLDAIMNPPSVTWRSVEKCKTAQVQVTRKGEKKPVFVYPSDAQMQAGNVLAPDTVKINPKGDFGLRPGDYQIVVRAMTADGIDVSNTDEKNIGRFTVLPVEPLEATTGLSVTPQELNRDYIIKTKSNAITFSWNKVRNATDYYFEIIGERNRTVLSQRVNGTSCVVDFNKMDPKYSDRLKRGTFKWTVEAVRRVDTDKDGKPDKVLQEGKKATGTFKTDIPTPKASKASGAKNPYGR